MAASLLHGEHLHWNKYCGVITRYTSYLNDRCDVQSVIISIRVVLKFLGGCLVGCGPRNFPFIRRG